MKAVLEEDTESPEWEHSPSDANSSDEKNDTESSSSIKGQQTPHSVKPANQESRKLHRKREKELNYSPSIDRKLPIPLQRFPEAEEIWQNMVYKEDASTKDRNPHLFNGHKFLSTRMRSILLDWVMEVCEVYKLRRVTYFLSVDYIDRYLTSNLELPKNQLQLLGITCLFIASKYEEIYPPKLSEFSYVTDSACSDEEILTKELLVLQTLDWNLNPMTVSGWLNLYMQIKSKPNSSRCIGLESELNLDFVYPQYSGLQFVRASLLLDVCSLDMDFLIYPYSVMAASAIYYVFNRETALNVSGLSWSRLRGCVEWMSPFWKAVYDIEIPHQSIFQGNAHPGSSNFASFKKIIPNLTPDESHSIQQHTVTLKTYEQAMVIQQEMYGDCTTSRSSGDSYESAISFQNQKEESDERCSTPLSIYISEDIETKVIVQPSLSALILNPDKVDNIENNSIIAP